MEPLILNNIQVKTGYLIFYWWYDFTMNSVPAAQMKGIQRWRNIETAVARKRRENSVMEYKMVNSVERERERIKKNTVKNSVQNGGEEFRGDGALNGSSYVNEIGIRKEEWLSAANKCLTISCLGQGMRLLDFHWFLTDVEERQVWTAWWNINPFAHQLPTSRSAPTTRRRHTWKPPGYDGNQRLNSTSILIRMALDDILPLFGRFFFRSHHVLLSFTERYREAGFWLDSFFGYDFLVELIRFAHLFRQGHHYQRISSFSLIHSAAVEDCGFTLIVVLKIIIL